MKRLAAVIAFAALMDAAPAFADTIENGYGNTFVVTLANGVQANYHFNADGSFTATTPDGATQTGAYTATDGQLCFIVGENQQCAPLISGKNVGDTWTQLDAEGNEITVTLQAGR